MEPEKIPEIIEVNATVLTDDSAGSVELLAEHGFTLFLEAKYENDDKTIILLDTGQTGAVLLHNAKALNLDLSSTDGIVISHGHYDHSGGLMDVLNTIGKRIPVILHPEAFHPKFRTTPPFRYIGMPWTLENLQDRAIVVSITAPFEIVLGCFTTGQIPRRTPFETVERFRTVKNTQIQLDLIQDDQALVLKIKEKGLVIFTGCAHSGIINTVQYASEITKINKIHAILGGFHLLNASEERISATIDGLRKMSPEFLGPCHCTGFPATKRLSDAFPRAFHEIYTGYSIQIKA